MSRHTTGSHAAGRRSPYPGHLMVRKHRTAGRARHRALIPAERAGRDVRRAGRRRRTWTARSCPPASRTSPAFQIPGYATAVRFAPDGRVFVAAKDGIVYEFALATRRRPSTPTSRSEVSTNWDRGLLGLAVDPDFATGRPYIYVAYTYDKAPGDPTVPRWSDGCPDPVDDRLPGRWAACPGSRPTAPRHVLLDGFCDQSPSHSIGTLAFGPDGALYVSARRRRVLQQRRLRPDRPAAEPLRRPAGRRGHALAPPDSEGGALRAQSFGRPGGRAGDARRRDPAHRPGHGRRAARPTPRPATPTRTARRIVAYGFRNPFRFTFRPGTGELWVGDVGFGAWEEIDRMPDISTGAQLRLAVLRGRRPPGLLRGGEPERLREALRRRLGRAPVLRLLAPGPRAVAGDRCPTGSSSISGIAFYDAPAFPAAYRGALFFADYSRQCIWVMYPGAERRCRTRRRARRSRRGAGWPSTSRSARTARSTTPTSSTAQIRRIAHAHAAPHGEDRASTRTPRDGPFRRQAVQRPGRPGAHLRVGSRRRRRVRRLDRRRSRRSRTRTTAT